MRKLLLLLLLLLTLASCDNKYEVLNDKYFINDAVDEIIEYTGWDTYAFTYQKAEGKFSLTDVDHVYAITFYVVPDESHEVKIYTYLTWFQGDDIDWEEIECK